MPIPFRSCLASAALCLLVALPLTAQAARKSPPPKVDDPRAVEILEKSCAYLAGLSAYAFKAEVLVDLVYQGKAKIQVARTMDAAVRRPDAFKVETTGDDVASTAVYDGKTFTLALNDRHLYNQMPATGKTDALIDLLHAKYGLDSPLGDLLRTETCSGLDYRAVSYLGLGYVGRTRCHHLFFQGVDADWQFWIEDGPAPLLRKMVITEKNMPMAPQFTAFLADWRTDGAAAANFDYTPAKSYTRDPDLFTHLKIEAQGGSHVR